MDWTEAKARRWMESTPTPMRFMLRAMIFWSSRSIDWQEPQELPERFVLQARPHQCVRDSLEAIEQHPSLQLVAGFAFRPERAEGFEHFWTSEGGVAVDPGAPVELGVKVIGEGR